MLCERGSLVWRILFGVVMAALLIGIFLVYTGTQREYAAGKEAQALANDLSKTAFSVLRGQKPFNLPETVGRAEYGLEVENNTFIVRILGGDLKGRGYRSTVGVKLEVRSLPEAGGILYLRGRSDRVIVSAFPIEAPKGKLRVESFKPPAFYKFARDNPSEATGIIASYYYAKQAYPNVENLDIRSYRWDPSENLLMTRVTSNGDFLTSIYIEGGGNHENVGYIDNFWVVTNFERVDQDICNIWNCSSCPSVDNAHTTGWLYPPKEVSAHLQRRTWRRIGDNETIVIPSDVDIQAATLTTNVSTYPTWRLKFSYEGTRHLVHFAAMPWNPTENQPGFVLESEPELEAIK